MAMMMGDSPSLDEISVFLHQFLLRHPPSPSPSPYSDLISPATQPPPHVHAQSLSQSPSFKPWSSDASASILFSRNVNVSCGHGDSDTSAFYFHSAGGGSEQQHDADECEDESCEEALAEELSKPLCKSSSKRTRDAQLHNLSEKRRRSRINEKMKALQKLIPNSSKTDKASMLDEAIEYLKQLQFQVQMLSVRNGVNLDPMCSIPESVLKQARLGRSSMELGSGGEATERRLLNNARTGAVAAIAMNEHHQSPASAMFNNVMSHDQLLLPNIALDRKPSAGELSRLLRFPS